MLRLDLKSEIWNKLCFYGRNHPFYAVLAPTLLLYDYDRLPPPSNPSSQIEIVTPQQSNQPNYHAYLQVWGQEKALALLKEMLIIRAFEEKAEELYALGKVHGTMHLSICHVNGYKTRF